MSFKSVKFKTIYLNDSDYDNKTFANDEQLKYFQSLINFDKRELLNAMLTANEQQQQMIKEMYRIKKNDLPITIIKRQSDLRKIKTRECDIVEIDNYNESLK